ncbi:LysR substrate-binding domain-containing protein [Variovorax sp. ZT4R33]|uniref:LysR family transcriptional regulator n=1 Tax=Variovorax sp. ZT4R33 TaxID=3443743 RepID=UPI003F47B718
MDSLELLRAFSEVASSGSFSRTAKHLSLSRGTVSKYIATLESRFGVRLLNRNSRAVSLTDAGLLLLERSKPILELAEVTHAELQDRARVPSGRLRISAPHGMDLTELPALIDAFLGHYPEVSISLILTNRMVDLVEDGVDIALRFGASANENLIVRQLVPMALSVCAAPMYWRKHGVPAHPGELANHVALISGHLNPLPKWRFEADGRPVDVAVRGRLDATEAGPLIQAALLGAGVVYLPSVMLEPYVESGRLVPVLSDFVRSDMWLSAVYLQRRHSTAVHRAFLDFLANRLKPAGSRMRMGINAQ